VFVLAATEQLLVKLWSDDRTVREIGVSIGMSPSAVCRHALRLGLPRRSRFVSEPDRAEFSALHAQGLNIGQVASRTGFHRDTVRKSLVADGVTLRNPTRRWPVRHDAFAPPETAETGTGLAR
jgi:hypothetical protein